MTVVKKLNREEGMAVVAITHFMEEALEADKIVVMDDGKVFVEGGKEIFEREAELEKIGLSAPLACGSRTGFAKKESTFRPESLPNPNS